jgi:TRAP-type mannitol/chloroaromatic compound transport system substrate-binding protein
MTKLNYTPAIILGLVAALVSVSSLLVVEKASSYQPAGGVFTTDNNQQRYEWTMVTSWPKNLPGLGRGAENIARFINEMSAGRLHIRVLGAGELVPALGVFDAVSSGSAEMAHSGAYYWKGKIPAVQFFTTVPFGHNAQEMNGWLYYGGGMELWRELYAPFNLIPFAAGNSGTQMAGWFNREINSVEDLKGLKMRIPGLGGEVLNRAGGSAVNVPGGELYTAMQTGVIDATEWVGPYNDLAQSLHQVAKYYYYPGWHDTGPTLELMVNKTAFESLPQDLQAIVTYAARAVNQDMLDEYTYRNAVALEQLKQDPNIEIRRLPDDVIRTLRKITEDIYAETAASDPAFKQVWDSYRAYANKVRPYHAISEQAYYEVREK